MPPLSYVICLAKHTYERFAMIYATKGYLSIKRGIDTRSVETNDDRAVYV